MMKAWRIALFAAAAALPVAPVSAAVIAKDLAFTVSNAAGPIANHSGTFSFQYDEDNFSTATLTAIDFSIGGSAFDLSTAGLVSAGAGWYLIGLVNGAAISSSGPADFWLGFSEATLAPRGGMDDGSGMPIPGTAFRYHASGVTGHFSPSSNSDIKIYDLTATAAVPEPTTWALMIVGFGAIGGAMRRGRLPSRQRLLPV